MVSIFVVYEMMGSFLYECAQVAGEATGTPAPLIERDYTSRQVSAPGFTLRKVLLMLMSSRETILYLYLEYLLMLHTNSLINRKR